MIQQSIKIMVLFAGLVTALGGKSSAQDSLAGYFETAARNNPLVMQRYYEYQSALKKVPQAGSLQDPELNAGYYIMPMELVEGKQLGNIQLMQMFPWFGTLKAAKNEMNLMANAKYDGFRDALAQVHFDVANNWYQLYRVKKEIQISEKKLEYLNTLENLANIRYRSAGGFRINSSNSSGTLSGNTVPASSGGSMSMQGGLPVTGPDMAGSSGNTASSMNPSGMNTNTGSGLEDLLRIQMEKNELESSIRLLKDRLKTASVKFNALLNREADQPVYVADTLAAISDIFPDRLLLLDSIFKNNLMLSMLVNERSALEARQQMIHKMGFPMIGAGLNYMIIGKSDMVESEKNGTDMVMPMLTVTLPVYRKKYRSMAEENKLNLASLEQGYASLSNSLQSEFYEASQMYEDSERRLKLLTKQNELLDKIFRLQLAGYTSAATGLETVLDTFKQTLDYEFRQTEAVVDQHTAIAWFNRLMAKSVLP